MVNKKLEIWECLRNTYSVKVDGVFWSFVGSEVKEHLISIYSQLGYEIILT